MDNKKKIQKINRIGVTFFSIFLLLVLLSVIFSGTSSLMPSNKSERVNLSQAIRYIRTNPVKEIIVRPEVIDITLSSGKHLIAKKESSASFLEILKNFGFTPEQISQLNLKVGDNNSFNFWMGVLLPIILPLLFFVWLFYYFMKRSSKGAMQMFSFSRANIKLFNKDKNRVTFKDVAGLKEAKEEMKEIVDFLKHPKKFQDLGARIPRGVLLMGAPGSGKTLLARAVAGEANVPFFHMSGSEFVEMFVGIGASRVRDAFATAKKASPSILFIDEIDAIGRVRGAGIGGGQDEREQTLNQILVEMDGFDRNTRVIVMAATNRPDILDPALLRPGRFDRRIVLDLPNIKDREDILFIHCRDKHLDTKVNLREIAERTPGFSGADLANLVNEAAILSARRGKTNISQQEFLESIEKVMLGPERKSRILTTQEKNITAYHEAGHALVSALLPDTAQVRKVSIIARGRAGGYTMRMPQEEKYMKTRSEFMNELCVLLGGYVAEEIQFKEMSTGAANDLKEASGIARSIVTKYGMDKKIGPVSFGKAEDLVFLGKEISTRKNYSEETAAKIDKEIEKILKNSYKRTKVLLKKNKEKLDRIAKALFKKETLEKEEFENLIKEKK